MVDDTPEAERDALEIALATRFLAAADGPDGATLPYPTADGEPSPTRLVRRRLGTLPLPQRLVRAECARLAPGGVPDVATSAAFNTIYRVSDERLEVVAFEHDGGGRDALGAWVLRATGEPTRWHPAELEDAVVFGAPGVTIDGWETSRDSSIGFRETPTGRLLVVDGPDLSVASAWTGLAADGTVTALVVVSR